MFFLRKLKNTNPNGSHGLHQGSFKLQTMTILIKSFYRCFTGTVFSKRVTPGSLVVLEWQLLHFPGGCYS